MITDVNVSPLPYSTNGTLALASATVDNAVVISSIAVKQNQNGELYVQMPQKFNKTKGAYEDVAFPITSAARDELVSKVIAKYNNPSISYDIRDKVNIEPEISANISKYQNPLESGQIGAGTLTVGDSFVIRNVKAYQSAEKGQFYLMPQYKALSGEFKSIVAPASKDMHRKITDVVKTELNTDYSYRSVDNETFQKLRDTCPDLFKQCSSSDGKNVKIKFDTADKAKINETLANIVNAAKPNLNAAAAAVPKPAMPRM